MKKLTKILSLVLVLSMLLSLFAGCGAKTEAPAAENAPAGEAAAPAASSEEKSDTLVVATQNFDGKFSPFFSTNSYETEINELVQLAIGISDRVGAPVLKGIEGETRNYNGTDYLYQGIADITVTENADGTVYYDYTMLEDVKFSDGHLMNIDDVIFSLYVYADPTYDGSTTFFALPVQGMEAYRSGMDSKMNLIAAAGPDGYTATEFFTEDEYNGFWTAFWAAAETMAQEITDYCVANGYITDNADAAGAASSWNISGVAAGATMADFAKAIAEAYNYVIADMDAEAASNTMTALFEAEMGDALANLKTGVQTGESAANISGIIKTGDYSMRIVLDKIDAAAIYQLLPFVAPLHYYGEEDKFDIENNYFGFPKGDLSIVKSVTSNPIGAGPYKFVNYENGKVTLEANENYYFGCPKTKYIVYMESQEVDKVPGVVTGTIDLTDPAYNAENAKSIAEANGGATTGDIITTNMVANRGYGYVGFNSKTVNVGGENGSEASKNLRKAIATVISVYRDVAVDSYYGEYANVINYPISDTSWAAPRVTDEGYKLAFSVDVNGNDIYTDGMSAEEKYAAAQAAALEYFEAAGYTVADGKLTAAPEGAAMAYEVMVGAGGTGDHPTFMALTMASASLAEIGFNLIVSDMANFAEMTNAINGGTHEMICMAWNTTVDPDMYQIYHSEGGSNYQYEIQDETLDELIMMARESTDQTYRKTLYKECLDIVADWAVEIPIYQRQNVLIFSTERVNMDTITPDITTFWSWRNDAQLIEMN